MKKVLIRLDLSQCRMSLTAQLYQHSSINPFVFSPNAIDIIDVNLRAVRGNKCLEDKIVECISNYLAEANDRIEFSFLATITC